MYLISLRVYYRGENIDQVGVAHVYNFSTWKTQAGGLQQPRSHPGSHNKFKANLVYKLIS